MQELNAFVVIVWYNVIVMQLRFNSATSNKQSVQNGKSAMWVKGQQRRVHF